MLGHSPTAPVSRRLLEQPNATDSYSDALSADEVATGVRPLPAGLTHEQAAGVAAGLMWALGRSHEAPSPLGEDAPLRDRAQIEHEYQGNLGLAKNPPPQWSPGQVEEELGVLAALGWVLGKSSSPLKGLTGAVGPSRCRVRTGERSETHCRQPGWWTAVSGVRRRRVRRLGLGPRAKRPSAGPAVGRPAPRHCSPAPIR